LQSLEVNYKLAVLVKKLAVYPDFAAAAKEALLPVSGNELPAGAA